MSEIINHQRKVKIDTMPFQIFTRLAAEEVAEARGKTITVAFVSDRKMRELNRMFRHKNSTTDVLSFPFEDDEFETADSGVSSSSSLQQQPPPPSSPHLGDIVISLEQAARQAAANNLTLENEIKQLILHGILHLSGYDHEIDRGEMNTLELKLRDKLGI